MSPSTICSEQKVFTMEQELDNLLSGLTIDQRRWLEDGVKRINGTSLKAVFGTFYKLGQTLSMDSIETYIATGRAAEFRQSMGYQD